MPAVVTTHPLPFSQRARLRSVTACATPPVCALRLSRRFSPSPSLCSLQKTVGDDHFSTSPPPHMPSPFSSLLQDDDEIEALFGKKGKKKNVVDQAAVNKAAQEMVLEMEAR